MCEETGIGSGSIHYGNRLFLTIEDAQVECDRRNEEEGNSLDRWNELAKQGLIVNPTKYVIRDVTDDVR